MPCKRGYFAVEPRDVPLETAVAQKVVAISLSTRSVFYSASNTLPYARLPPHNVLLLLHGSASQGSLPSASAREGPRVSGRGLMILEGALWKSICWKISSSRRLTSENKRKAVSRFDPIVLLSFGCGLLSPVLHVRLIFWC